MKKRMAALLLAGAMLMLSAAALAQEETVIVLSDAGVTVNGEAASQSDQDAVYVANDIVFYLEGQDFAYGEGGEDDGHAQAEADAHTVVHIAKPGTYRLSGEISAGQVAVDLGEGAKEDETAVVTLILDGVDITSTVAPAVIFYSVYECGSTDADTAVRQADTSLAGANVVIADGTVNTVNGSYVARIYDPQSVELSEDGSEIVAAEKLHKYDGAFYSRCSMNVSGEEKGDGVLNIHAKNEGLDSELHLTIDGGVINIVSGNDGINTNEDNVSVCTISGGEVNILVSGETGEGDGIDSNGWVVISGGKVAAYACAFSGDAGIDSDRGIHIDGGEVLAAGHMLDRIEAGGQTYAVFEFASRMKGGTAVTLKDEHGDVVAEYAPVNDYTNLIVSGGVPAQGTYTLWQGDVQLSGYDSEMRGMMMPMGDFGGEPPEGVDPEKMTPPQMPEGMEPPQRPEGMERQGAFEKSNEKIDEKGFDGERGFGGRRAERSGEQGETSTAFVIKADGSVFSGVGPAEN